MELKQLTVFDFAEVLSSPMRRRPAAEAPPH